MRSSAQRSIRVIRSMRETPGRVFNMRRPQSMHSNMSAMPIQTSYYCSIRAYTTRGGGERIRRSIEIEMILIHIVIFLLHHLRRLPTFTDATLRRLAYADTLFDIDFAPMLTLDYYAIICEAVVVRAPRRVSRNAWQRRKQPAAQRRAA